MTGDDMTMTNLSIDDEVYEAAAGATKILCLVPEGDPGDGDHEMWLAVDAAISLARTGCRPVMFDAITNTMESPIATEAEADVPVAQVSKAGWVSLIVR